jgi:murein L,D-transpeptidase YcbB/YkuD
MKGTQKVGVRQLPGGKNMMGAVKFIFPNNLGVYLHDTPHRAAFELTNRQLSSGCVRVERASDLYRWLFRHELPAPSSSPEQRVILPEPVPVYLFRFTSGGSAKVARVAAFHLSPRDRFAQDEMLAEDERALREDA